jgi:hypothetical protein
MKSKMFYLQEKTAKELETIAFIVRRSQSNIVEMALHEYLFDMKNALSEDDQKAELIKQLLGE